MPIFLYGMAMCPHTDRVLATLFEKGAREDADFTLEPINPLNGDHKDPRYLRIQPFGQIPAIEDGDLILFESRAIARYIARKFGGQGTPLYGFTRKDKALVEQWLEIESQNYHPAISAVVAEILFKPLQHLQTDQAVVDANLVKLGKVMDVYEAHLTNHKYLAGDFFSLADLSHIPYGNYLINFAMNAEVFETRPHVKAWWDDISSRPSWKKVEELFANAVRAIVSRD